jgi:RNA polymerase sigma-70 factor (ECF subfamily)
MNKPETLQDIALSFVESRTENTFNKLYHRLKPGLRKMTMKYHQDEETINDILAITLSKAYVYVDMYDSRWNFSTWVYKICQNECLMELRRKASTYSLNAMEEANIKVKPAVESDWSELPEYEFFSNGEVMESDKVYDEIMLEIDKLPSPYKDVLQDREIHKLKYEEIAEKQNIKINTVRSRIHVAKKLVKNKWTQKKRETIKGEIEIKNVGIIKADKEIPNKDDSASIN